MHGRGHRQYRRHHRDPGQHLSEGDIMNVMVLNVGSTTLKAAWVDCETKQTTERVTIDRIGQQDGEANDHETAVKKLLQQAGERRFDAIGHRVVQGGPLFSDATAVTDESLGRLSRLDTLAPLHNPPARRVIERTFRLLGEVPQAMVFDTAYFADLPRRAAQYAIPKRFYEQHQIRRYGAHGTSHQYVIEAAREYSSGLDKIISLHLGGGASVTASADGKALETSMGLTPLEGLVMATRCGDIDPSVVMHLIRQHGLSVEEVDDVLNRQSGMLGLCGDVDMREILRKLPEDEDCRNAVEIYVHRIRKYIGAYIAVLGGLDGLVFTAGVGQHSAEIRKRVTRGLDCFGIGIDDGKNAAADGNSLRDISDSSAAVRTLVIPTDESLAIAIQTAACFQNQ
jgi:acetate kinase